VRGVDAGNNSARVDCPRGPVADRRGHPLDRTRTHVADGEDARQIGLERTLDIAAGTDKTLVVERDAGGLSTFAVL